MSEEAKHTPTLKPCPFCGGPAGLQQNGPVTGRQYWEVSCDACDFVACDALTQEKSAELWNRRSYAELATLRTKLESAEKAADAFASAVSEAMQDGKGFWRSCSGCHELNEGHSTGPYSKTFKCHIGVGCYECGGIGAIWDTTDYAEMGTALSSIRGEQP